MLLRSPLRNPRVVWLLATFGLCVAVAALTLAVAIVALPIPHLHALVILGAVGVVASGCAATSAVLVAAAKNQVAVAAAERERLEAQLRELHKMQAVGRVTAGVAHDFNNLLQTLGGSLELLIAAVADRPDAVELGQLAQRATLRATKLTSHLLSFSRQQVLLSRPVSIDALFSGMEMLISDLLVVDVATRSELSMLPAAAGLAVQADPAQLEVALINLALNARDAMVSGGRLRISAHAADADPAIVPPGRYTVISVADTGIGMDADTVAQAFEPFFSTKGRTGTGLGLSMVQGFARQSGGEAHITSVPGEGTTIDLWLPAASSPCEVEPAPAAAKPIEQQILVVDDSQDSLVLAAAFLRLAGMEVTTAASGDLALAEMARGSRFGAMVTDFAMTGMNGLELLTLAHGVDPAMVGMVITGLSDSEIPAGLEGVVVLRKPFNRADLTQTVQRLIAVKRASRTRLSRLGPARSGMG